MSSLLQIFALGLSVLDVARGAAVEKRDTATGDIDYSIPGYETVIPAWKGPAFVDGPDLILNGTVEQVHDQLVALNPNYDSDFGFTEPKAQGHDEAGLTKRNVFPDDAGYNCFGQWGFVFTDTLWAGIDYLRGVGGQPWMGPGFGTCARVSCSYRTAIWWCNDNPYVLTLGSYGEIADGAELIFSRCIGYAGFPPDIRTSAGQIFHYNGWNVIVRDDNC